MCTLIICTVLYASTSVVLTMMVPYYNVDINAPFARAFRYVDIKWATYIVSAGAIISLTTCLYAGIYPLSRIAYSIALDGLLFKKIAFVSEKFRSPAVSVLLTGFLTGWNSKLTIR